MSKPVSSQRAPAYIALLPTMQEIAHEFGYALAVHGSCNRDLDLIAVPWVEDAKEPAEMVEGLRSYLGGIIHKTGTPAAKWNGKVFEPCILENPSRKPHGRLAWNIHLDCGLFIDISVTPRQ